MSSILNYGNCFIAHPILNYFVDSSQSQFTNSVSCCRVAALVRREKIRLTFINESKCIICDKLED